jgi:hypothetical protein
MHLDREFAGGRDNERHRQAGRPELFSVPQDGRREGEAVGDCFAGAGLRRDQQVTVRGIGQQHRQLYVSRVGARCSAGFSTGKVMRARTAPAPPPQRAPAMPGAEGHAAHRPSLLARLVLFQFAPDLIPD